MFEGSGGACMPPENTGEPLRKKSKTMAGGEATENRLATEITLNEVETDVFTTIRAVLQHFELKTVVRCAGGWVRDKLLQIESDDIDLAVDDMNGAQFAEMINKYLAEVKGEEVHKIGVIQENPEQSKHLETATFKLHGHWIDVNNLRTESYSEHSRIPQTSIGTAAEDAFRRGLTINSLFYNINNGEIEDMTGHGLSDLRRGVIRTPLEPMQTLLDDPLRALRSIRFAGRFKFQLDPVLKAAMQSDKVKDAIAHKISRERVGMEVRKMAFAERSDPVLSFRMIVEVGLYDIVFEFPTNLCEGTPVILPYSKRALLSLQAMERAQEFIESKECKLNLKDQRTLLFSAFCYPLHRTMCFNRKRKPRSVIEFIVGDSLRLGKKLIADMCHLLDSAEGLERVIMAHLKDESLAFTEAQRLDIGHCMRLVGERWHIALELAMALHANRHHDAQKHAVFARFEQWFENSDLRDVWMWKTLLNGKDMMQLFNVSGPIVKVYLDKQLDWQILHPKGTAAEVTDYLRSLSLSLS